MPAFPQILTAISEAYRNRKGEVDSTTKQIVDHIRSQSAARPSPEPLTRDILSQAYRALSSAFDAEHGGFGSAPKFPQPMTLEFLLRYWHETGDQQALHVVELTLDKMARGGMYDQVGGGFHRYSTDALWLVPHFEKMLYDNALLVQLYLHGWQATGNAFYRRIAEETLAYVEREMLDPAGGFYSAQDADSEGVEGKYFVWTPAEIDELLGPDLAPIVRAYYAITDPSNFEGASILWRPAADGDVARGLGISPDALQAAITEARPRLRAARERRVPPGRDDKVLTSWNALMLKAFAEAGAALNEPRYVDIARRNAEFILSSLIRDGRLLRTWKADVAKLNAYLEDHAYLIDALLALYEGTFEQHWLDEASSLADRMVDLFWDAEAGVFFDTGSDHERLVVRPRESFDNATPSGGSAAALALLRLAVFTGEPDHQRRAVDSIRAVRDYLTRVPTGFANWLCALDFYLSTPKEIVVIGPRDDPATQALLRVAHERYLPNRAVAGADAPLDGTTSPLLEGREMIDGRPTAYVCESYACQLPVTDPDALSAQLGRADHPEPVEG